MAVFLPETNTSHDILYSLDLNAKIMTRDGNIKWKRDGIETKWRQLCKYDDGWIDCWSAPKIQLNIAFMYHPIPLSGPPPQADLPTPDKDDSNPLHAPTRTKSKEKVVAKTIPDDFDPTSLEADKVKVDLTVGASTAYLYGTLIRNFMHLKENIFGADQHFTPMDSSDDVTNSSSSDKDSLSSDRLQTEFDERLYRPLEVILDIRVHDLQAHLIKNCSENGSTPCCPYLIAEQLVFEMDKNYRETRLQLALSPVILRAGITEGFIVLSGLQFRGNAMFSELDRPLDSDTLEYAWLIEIQCGSLIGKISAPQLFDVVISLETFVYLLVDKENVLKNPRPYKICQHNVSQKECQYSTSEVPCSGEEDVKYKLVRFSSDYIDLNIVEKSSALRLQLCPLRFATCNLHGRQTKRGVTALIKQVLIQGSNASLLTKTLKVLLG